MKVLFTLEAQIQGKSINIDVKENLDIFTIAKSIAIEHSLGAESQQQIMIVMLQTLAGLLDSSDSQLKVDICKLLTNTIKQQTNSNYFASNHKNINDKKQQIKSKKSKQTISLYDRALILKEQKQKFSKVVKQIEAEDQIKQCTFQPSINYYPIQRNNTHEILYNNARMIKQKQDKIRRHKKQHETDGYTFRPQINEQSLKLAKNRSCNSFKRNSSYLQQQFSHHPELSKGTQKLAQRFPNFQKRLQKYMKVKKQASFQKQNSMISKSDKTQKPDKYKQIFDNEQKDLQRRMKLYNLLPLACKHQSPQLSQNNLTVKNSKSQQLFLKKKIRLFKYIFNCIEQDQVVNQQSIDNNSLPQEIYYIVLPLLKQISQLQVSLDKEQFINSLQRLYNSLNTIDKQLLINIETKKKWQQGHERYRNKYKFKPTISQKSKDLAFQRQLRPLRTFENQSESESDIISDDYVFEKQSKEEEQSLQSKFIIEQEQEQQEESDEEIQLL